MLTITHISVKNHLEDLGEDMVYFEVDVLKDGEEYMTMLSLYRLRKYCSELMPEIAGYLDSVRHNITGFGPKETKMWAMMQEEGFDISPVIVQILESGKHFLEKKETEPLTEKEHAALQKFVAEMDESAAGMKHSNIRDIAFKDNLIELLSAKVLEYYPEIFESEPEHIKEVHSILVNNILRLASDLDSLSYKAEKGEED